MEKIHRCPQQGRKIREQKHPEKHEALIENCWSWQRSRLRAGKMGRVHKDYLPHNVDYMHNGNSPHGVLYHGFGPRLHLINSCFSHIIALAWTECVLQSVMFIVHLKNRFTGLLKSVEKNQRFVLRNRKDHSYFLSILLFSKTAVFWFLTDIRQLTILVTN